jgi:hypothetical protein
MNVYTHIGLGDQTSAIEMLPSPPPLTPEQPSNETALATGTDGHQIDDAGSSSTAKQRTKKVPTMVPRGAENGAVRLASETSEAAPTCTDDDGRTRRDERRSFRRNALTRATIRTEGCDSASPCTTKNGREKEVRPTGFEPVTLGSEDRCAIQLRHGRECCCD